MSYEIEILLPLPAEQLKWWVGFAILNVTDNSSISVYDINQEEWHTLEIPALQRLTHGDGVNLRPFSATY